MANPKKGSKRKAKKNVKSGIAHITSTFNNTVVTLTDVSGNVIAWSSSGVKGFKGSRKSTPFAAQLAAEDAAHKAQECGIQSLGGGAHRIDDAVGSLIVVGADETTGLGIAPAGVDRNRVPVLAGEYAPTER